MNNMRLRMRVGWEQFVVPVAKPEKEALSPSAPTFTPGAVFTPGAAAFIPGTGSIIPADVAAEDDHQVRDYLLSQKLTIKHQYPVQETLLHLDKDKLATEQLIDPML